jgi:hypothetical protein
VGNPRMNCVADELSSTPAGRSRQPRTNKRKCGNQPAHQSLLNRRLKVLSPAPRNGFVLTVHPSCGREERLRPMPLTTNIRVHARQLALEPNLQILRRHRRPLLRRLEQAHRSALADHVHRTARMGLCVMISECWYNARDSGGFGGPQFEQHRVDVNARNAARIPWQRVGLGLILASFVVQGSRSVFRLN